MELDVSNIAEYLRTRGYLAPAETVQARELSGGVSNLVIHVSRFADEDLVLKQGRGQLNVEEPWFCSIDRIWREVDVLRVCERLLTTSRLTSPLQLETPRLLFDDRENHVYAMTAAPPDHVVWKSELLAGLARADVAEACGLLLACLHSRTWHDRAIAASFDDRHFFDDLRVDPYYRHVAGVHAELRPAIEALIESVWDERHCLVHGDFSPKNLLVCDNRLMLIDFEVGHFGDPSFDLGFFLSHLMLKAFYHAPREQAYFDLIDSFWKSYLTTMLNAVSADEVDSLIRRAVLNFAGCALARLDGKSRIDYLTDDGRRAQMRWLCRIIFMDPPAQWNDVMQLARRALTNQWNPLPVSAKGRA